MVDKIEAIRVDKLRYLNVATSNTKDARRSLFAIVRDDDKRRFVFSHISYKDQVYSETEFMQSRRRQEKERLEEYLVSEEKDVAARKMQHDKAAEEWGGCSYDILIRPNLVWIPGPDYYFG
jgi:hypothetical protein